MCDQSNPQQQYPGYMPQMPQGYGYRPMTPSMVQPWMQQPQQPPQQPGFDPSLTFDPSIPFGGYGSYDNLPPQFRPPSGQQNWTT